VSAWICIVLSATQASAQAAADVMLQPPNREECRAPSGVYSLVIELQPHRNVHAARSTATLFRSASPRDHVLWARDLPHRPRPRFCTVSDNGYVVLLDEWLNIRSELAVMVIDPQNRMLAQFNLEAVRGALGVPIGALAPLARHGVWIQAPPVISAQGDAVEIAAANRLLSIRLRDGAMSSR
jgi:hypothetical protein